MHYQKSAILALTLCAMSSLFAASKIFPYPYVQEDLPNGLRLITIPTDYPNIVSLYIVVGTGSRNEVEPGKSGFAHLFEHLMFRGTKEYPPDRYQNELQGAGAASNAFTTDDFTAFHTTFSKEDLPRILTMEADRFQHLSVDPAAFKTETLAVLGEYNKNSASPAQKLYETVRATAFKVHTYQHTTMGFLKDVEAMPTEYDYSLQFFDRYYRPEYTTIIVAGDVDPKRVRSLIDERWGVWKRGSYKPSIPAEPPQDAPAPRTSTGPPRRCRGSRSSTAVPRIPTRARKPPRLTPSRAWASIRLLRSTRNSSSRNKRSILSMAGPPNNLDPELFGIYARVKKATDLPAIQQQIVDTAQAFAASPADPKKLEALKEHLRYEFALQLNNSESIAQTVAQYVALRRTPETINRYYDQYAKLTPADIQKAARNVLIDKNRTVVTLTSSAGTK